LERNHVVKKGLHSVDSRYIKRQAFLYDNAGILRNEKVSLSNLIIRFSPGNDDEKSSVEPLTEEEEQKQFVTKERILGEIDKFESFGVWDIPSLKVQERNDKSEHVVKHGYAAPVDRANSDFFTLRQNDVHIKEVKYGEDKIQITFAGLGVCLVKSYECAVTGS
jgi:hypothetical protein